MISAGESGVGGVRDLTKPEVVDLEGRYENGLFDTYAVNAVIGVVSPISGNTHDYFVLREDRVAAYVSCKPGAKFVGGKLEGDCITVGGDAIPESKRKLLPEVEATPLAEAKRIIQRLRGMLVREKHRVKVGTEEKGNQTLYHISVPGRSETVAAYHIGPDELFYGGALCRGVFNAPDGFFGNDFVWGEGTGCYIRLKSVKDSPLSDPFSALRNALKQAIQQQIALREAGSQ